ncbi:unnamed protein product [Bursaphelenchus okinawaensis]|uniref:MADF domain-containing protein n=1 Tax=Bursaphelenchus okinawaensis TaxID=465554 RepID=A0A811JT99_9BILA|nr:unnamed protein product [Bursaphelenchus okinawaensis]CAG9082767.1 unnamed protein product [Bursaphelenchus okinawaensis]
MSEHSGYVGDGITELDSGNGLSQLFGPVKKSRSAHYNDDIRLCIIEEVYKQPILWDPGNTERITMLQRRRAYSEIAFKIGNQENGLKAADVERQWKNLKDTYIKLKKKVTTDEQGNLLIPKWKFFRCLAFIDNEDLECFNIMEEIAFARKEHGIEAKNQENCKSNISDNSNRLLELSVEPIERPKKRMKLEKVVVKPSTSTVPRPTTSTPEVKNKVPPVMTPSSSKIERDDGLMDEYTAFCNSLIHPLKEIGDYSKLEYYKFQKMVRDALFDVQMKIHTSRIS